MLKSNEQKIFTPCVRSFVSNVGDIEGVELFNTSLTCYSNEIVLLTGSILDRAEVDYRQIMNCTSLYITVIKGSDDLKDMNTYWTDISIVVTKNELLILLCLLLSQKTSKKVESLSYIVCKSTTTKS